MNKQDLIDFEKLVADHWEAGDLPYLIHLSGGNEDFLIDLFKEVKDGDWIFSTHRNHHHALLSGVPRNELLAKIFDGNSMFVFDRDRHFFTSSILSGTCAIAAGVAYALKEEGSSNRVWCFLGDGAEEQGHFYEAVMMRDYPLIMAEVVIGAILTMLGNLIADISYAYVDPRIRYKK